MTADRRRPLGIGCGEFGVVEQQRRQGVAQMPLNMIGEHAEEDVGPYTVGGPMADGTDIEVDGLEASEGAFDPREILVGLNGFFGIKLRGRHGRADHIDAVETGLLLDLSSASLDAEMAVVDLDGEVLADLVAVDDRADGHADRRRACAAPAPGCGPDRARSRVDEVGICEVFQGMSIIHGGVAIGDLDVAPAFERCEHHEEVDGAVTLVLVVAANRTPRFHRDRHAHLGVRTTPRSVGHRQCPLHAFETREVAIKADNCRSVFKCKSAPVVRLPAVPADLSNLPSIAACCSPG